MGKGQFEALECGGVQGIKKKSRGLRREKMIPPRSCSYS